MFHTEKKVFIKELENRYIDINNLLDTYINYDFTEISKLQDRIAQKDINKIIFTGMGSSLYACDLIAKEISNLGFFATSIATSVVTDNFLNTLDESTLLVVVSQSGNSEEIIHLVEELSDNTPTIYLTNNKEGWLYRHVDNPFMLIASKEYYIAHNSYLNTILLLDIIFKFLLDTSYETEIIERKNSLKTIQEFESKLDNYKYNILDILANTSGVDFITSSKNYGNGLNSALLFREGLGIMASAYLADEYLHGEHLVQMSQKGTILLDVCVESNLFSRIVENENKYGNKLLVITSNENMAEGINNEYGYFVIKINRRNKDLMPMMVINKLVSWIMEENNNENRRA